jgi:hypothetical protein
MGIDIGGFAIAGNNDTSQIFKISAGAVDIFKIDYGGRTTYPKQIGFIAGLATDSGWVAQPAGWTAMKYFSGTVYNEGGGYSAGRFTAPVAGSYLFHYSVRGYKPTALEKNYSSAQFWVNGAHVAQGYTLDGYNQDTSYAFTPEIVDLIYLNAGDYVEVNINASVVGISFYRSYSIFAGMLVG